MDDLDPVPADPAAPQVEAHLPPGVTRGPETVRAFRQVLGNTLVANVTASYLWFALTFWAYLETRSVMATAIIGGGYMLFTAVFGTFFGTLVDRHRKKQVMVISSTVTLVAYAASAGLWLLLGEDQCIRCGLCAMRCPVKEITMEAFHFRSAESTGLVPIQSFDLRSSK